MPLVKILAVALLFGCGPDSPAEPAYVLTGSYGGVTQTLPEGIEFLLQEPDGDDGWFGEAVKIYVREGVAVIDSNGYSVSLESVAVGSALKVTLTGDACFESEPAICRASRVRVMN